LLEKLAVWGFALSSLVLTVTGVVGVWVLGLPWEGYLLLTHVASGAVFALSLSLLVVFWAEVCRFGAAANERDRPRFPGAGRKICFWLVTIAGLGLILSALLSMFPFLGTKGQQWMMDAHGLSTFLVLLTVLVYGLLFLSGVRTKKKKE